MSVHTVHLVRHGEVENPDHVVYASLPGFGLGERGRAQALAVGERLAGQPVIAVIASPLQRATETAAIVAAKLGLTVRGDSRLLEWELGEHWAGTPWGGLRTRFPGELEAYLDHPHDLDFTPEPLYALAVRVAAAVTEATDAARDGEVVVVSHQDPIQAGRLFLTEGSLATLQTDKPGHCSIVTLTRDAKPPQWRETAYWQPDQGTTFPPIRRLEN